MIHILRRRWKAAVAWIVCLVLPTVGLCAMLPFGFTTLQLINMALLLTLLGLLLIILQQGLEDRRAYELSQSVLSKELAARATTLELAVDARAEIAKKVVDAAQQLVDKTAEVLAVKVEETSEGIHDVVKDTGSHLADLIEDNTKKTEQATAAAKEAFKEANNVNVKISDLNKRLLQESKDRKSDQSDAQKKK